MGRHVAAAGVADSRIEIVAHTGRVKRRDELSLGGDLLRNDDKWLRSMFRDVGPDVVINAVGATQGSLDELRKLNVDLVHRLLAAISASAPRAHFIQLGSAAEYGLSSMHRPVRENDETRPVSEYGRTKLAATRLILEAIDRGASGTVLRVFNPIGAGAPSHSLIGTAARRIRDAIDSGSANIRLGPLDSWRDFIDATDVARAIIQTALMSSPRPPIINVGSGHASLTRDLAHQLAAIAQYSGRIDEEDSGSPRSAAVVWQQADTMTARTILGWTAVGSLEQALIAVWRDLTETQDARRREQGAEPGDEFIRGS